MTTLYVGVDPSINSSGISFYSSIDGKDKQWVVLAPNKITKQAPVFKYVQFFKSYDKSTYATEELSKIWTFLTIADNIIQLIHQYDEGAHERIIIGVEAPPRAGGRFGAGKSSSTLDLIALNAVIRGELIKQFIDATCSGYGCKQEMGVNKLDTVMTVELAKAIGVRNIKKKDDRIWALLNQHPGHDFGVEVKIDDIADAYGIAMHLKHKYPA